MITNSAGMNSNDRNVETKSPPMTAVAIGDRNSAPAPNAKALGTMPAIIAMLVMIMGRARFCTASIMAVERSAPS